MPSTLRINTGTTAAVATKSTTSVAVIDDLHTDITSKSTYGSGYDINRNIINIRGIIGQSTIKDNLVLINSVTNRNSTLVGTSHLNV